MPKLEDYKGYEIEIEDQEEDADTASLAAGIEGRVHRVKIGKRRIDVQEESGRFSTSHLPYTTYESIVELARAVVDHSPDYDTFDRS